MKRKIRPASLRDMSCLCLLAGLGETCIAIRIIIIQAFVFISLAVGILATQDFHFSLFLFEFVSTFSL